MTSTANDGPNLTPAQRHTFDALLAIGADRPYSRPGLVDELTDKLTSETADALSRWTENRMWVGKSKIFTTLRCEGMAKAEAEQPRDFSQLHPKTLAGIVAHRAIQIAHTHPDMPVPTYVDEALASARRSEENVRDSWDMLGLGEQSDLISEMVSKTTQFLDAWPPLDANWTPRFEESVVAKVGNLTLSGRLDLILGRPRGDGRQTMLLCDLKTGTIKDHHIDEASFYALIATLRHGVPPFRSVIYSLASASWTEADVTEDRLWHSLDQVIEVVNTTVDLMTEVREPTLTPDFHCQWCPLKDTCPKSSVRDDLPDGEDTDDQQEDEAGDEADALPVLDDENDPLALDVSQHT